MIGPLDTATNVFISCRPQDMRAGIERLARIVECEFELDPFSEALYVFVSRKADKMKMLRWDNNGWWLYYKKLSKGTFRWSFREDELVLQVEQRQLRWVLDGLAASQPLAHEPVTQRLFI